MSETDEMSSPLSWLLRQHTTSQVPQSLRLEMPFFLWFTSKLYLSYTCWTSYNESTQQKKSISWTLGKQREHRVQGISQNGQHAGNVERWPGRLVPIVQISQNWRQKHLTQWIHCHHHAVHVNQRAFVGFVLLNLYRKQLEKNHAFAVYALCKRTMESSNLLHVEVHPGIDEAHTNEENAET